MMRVSEAMLLKDAFDMKSYKTTFKLTREINDNLVFMIFPKDNYLRFYFEQLSNIAKCNASLASVCSFWIENFTPLIISLLECTYVWEAMHGSSYMVLYIAFPIVEFKSLFTTNITERGISLPQTQNTPYLECFLIQWMFHMNAP